MFQEMCSAVGELLTGWNEEQSLSRGAGATEMTENDNQNPSQIRSRSSSLNNHHGLHNSNITFNFNINNQSQSPTRRHNEEQATADETADLDVAALQQPASESSHSVVSNSNTNSQDHHRRNSSLASFADQLHLNLHASWTNVEEHAFGDRPVPVSRISSNASQTSTLVSATSFSGEDGISSAIHDAARITNWDTVKELCLRNPEAAKFMGKDRWTALHHACNRRCPRGDVVEALLRAYPDALLLEEDKGWYPLHYASRFKAPTEVVRLLVHLYPTMGKQAVQKKDKKGRTPLYYAVRYDAPPGVVEILLHVDPSVVLQEDQSDDSPMAQVWDSWAEKLEGKRTLTRIHGDNTKVWTRLQSQTRVLERWNNVQTFLKAFFGFLIQDSDTRPQREDSESLPIETQKWRMLHATAATKCHLSLFQLACALYPEQATELDNHDLRGPSNIAGGWLTAKNLTALHLAASSLATGDTGKSVIQKLMQLHPAAVQCTDSTGSLPLHRIVENRAKNHWSRDGAKEIYEAYQSGIEVPDADGRLPLHRAATAWVPQNDATQEATWARSVLCNLLEIYPAAAEHSDHFGQLPLHVAVKHAPSWDIQLQTLVDRYPQAVRTRTGVALGNRLPLHIAASNHSSEPSLIRKLVELHPRAASQADREGNLPLHLAIQTGLSWEAVQSILDAYPEAIHTPAPEGHNVLQMAAANKRATREVIANLVERYPQGAYVPDQNGRYALHLACISGKFWDGGLADLFDANPDAIRSADPLGLLPFHLVCFRYCQSNESTAVQPTMKRHHRRLSSKISVDAILREQTAEAREAEVLFQLLKADPTVL